VFLEAFELVWGVSAAVGHTGTLQESQAVPKQSNSADDGDGDDSSDDGGGLRHGGNEGTGGCKVRRIEERGNGGTGSGQTEDLVAQVVLPHFRKFFRPGWFRFTNKCAKPFYDT